jgi:hypothetical protein
MLQLLSSFLHRGSPSNGDSRLCQACRSIFQGQRKDKPLGVTATHPFPQTLQELQSSAEQGCHLCYIRWHDLPPADRKALEGCSRVTFGFWQSSIGDGIAFEYFYSRPQGGKSCLTKSVLIKPAEGKSSCMLHSAFRAKVL